MPEQPPPLSNRERQIMGVVFRAGRATAAEIHAALPDAPTYTTARGLLRILEQTGHLRHEEDGPRYVSSAECQSRLGGGGACGARRTGSDRRA